MGLTPEVVLAMPQRHYYKCPLCPGYADLETHRCRSCGSTVVAVQWSASRQLSPELVMVSRTDNRA